MEKGFILFVLAYIVVQINAQDAPLKVEFLDPSDRYVKLGDEVHLGFKLNRGLVFGVDNEALMERRRVVDGSEVVDVLSDIAKLEEAGVPEFYQVSVDKESADLTILFKILKVRDIDDATFMVRAIANNGEKANVSLKVIVLRENSKLKMKIGSNDFFSEKIEAPFSLDEGMYPVTCSAEGSNPATEDIMIWWNGEKLPLASTDKVLMDTPLQMYRTTVTAEVDVDLGTSGKLVECTATSRAGKQLHISAPIEVNVYDPEDLDGSEMKLDLTFHRVKQKNFGVWYLIITQKNGHMSKVPVKLNEIEGPSDSSSMLAASLVTLALCTVCALWKTL
ncbi:hypothetical protein EGW08_000106 [Elysia chlorotica]|uniref:Ig-like domain-containing protein n=1 Tax=Elysia chlorotica TaxID=188477 RepID=A0A3S1BYM1_ELYCH|nr:hypothetical protein EGW08_000106 [Elysia chlorotica]